MLTTVKRLTTPAKISQHYPGLFTEPSIRWLIFNEKTNGFSVCLRRIGRRILIDLDSFEQWIEEHK